MTEHTAFSLPPAIAGRLTPAECAIVRLVLTGSPNREIAQFRGSSEATVKHQLYSIYRKLGVESRARLMATLLNGPETPPLDCPPTVPA